MTAFFRFLLRILAYTVGPFDMQMALVAIRAVINVLF